MAAGTAQSWDVGGWGGDAPRQNCRSELAYQKSCACNHACAHAHRYSNWTSMHMQVVPPLGMIRFGLQMRVLPPLLAMSVRVDSTLKVRL